MSYPCDTAITAWSYEPWFHLPNLNGTEPAVTSGIQIVDQSGIDQHPFFQTAAESRATLKLWVSQELVVTNPFSQLLLDLASRIANLHIRAMVTTVASAEHGQFRKGMAARAHPWLLHRLGENVGVRPEDVQVLPETASFLRAIELECSRSTAASAGVLGMGSERLLVPEYSAIKRSFELGWPDSNFREFLDANILEDEAHAEIMEAVGTALIRNGEPADHFLEGARVGVEARLEYYDRLHKRCAQLMD